VIIAEYDAILSQWERMNFYNHLSNYTKNIYDTNLQMKQKKIWARGTRQDTFTYENKKQKRKNEITATL